jgi:hypothetical protein
MCTSPFCIYATSCIFVLADEEAHFALLRSAPSLQHLHPLPAPIPAQSRISHVLMTTGIVVTTLILAIAVQVGGMCEFKDESWCNAGFYNRLVYAGCCYYLVVCWVFCGIARWIYHAVRCSCHHNFFFYFSSHITCLYNYICAIPYAAFYLKIREHKPSNHRMMIASRIMLILSSIAAVVCTIQSFVSTAI